MEDYHNSALEEIAEICLWNMEGCDEPEFAAFDGILYIATHPMKYYEREMEKLDEYNRHHYTAEVVWNDMDDTYECSVCGAAVGHEGVNYCEECGTRFDKE